MERILKILGIAAIIFLLVYWISDISKGCNGSKDISDTEEVIQTSDEAVNGDEVNLEEDIFGEEESKYDTNSTKAKDDASKTVDEENVDDYVDYSGEVKETKKTTKETTNTSKPTKAHIKRHKASSGGGSYLVVAGSYLVKGNANKMKKKLYNLGYNSEIVNFDLSQYYSVLAGRFSSRKDANDAVTILKRSGIDCYVHRKKH